jgi:hypothetical protein
MKVMKCLSFFVVALLLTSAHATLFYRHVPFNLSISYDDKIVVDYNFSEKKGIRCTSNSSSIQLKDIAYKGHQNKVAALPVTLQSDHIPDPDKKDEMLADVMGKFSLETTGYLPHHKQYDVSCFYVKK